MKNRNNLSRAQWLAAVARTAVLGSAVACGGSGAAPATTAPASEHAHGHGHGREPAAHHHRFDDAAGWAKVFDDPERDAWQKPERVVTLMAIAPGMTVADVGAGTGYFEPHLSRAVGAAGKVLAEDIEPSMVDWINARAKKDQLANVTAHAGAADDPKLPAGAVDRIVVVDTWHHIQDRVDFARKLALALKPGGAIFIVDFTLDAPHGPPKAARLPPETIAGHLKDAGLAADVMTDAGLPHQYVVRGKR